MNKIFLAVVCASALVSCGAPAEGCKKDSDCKGTRICVSDVCQEPASTGGGTASTGGGTASTGGGTASTGGGTASTGGGTASTGGGTASTGGGTAITGGGTASTGGGTASTGGGTGTIGVGGGTGTGGGTPTATFYVSTTGNDSTGTGSMAAPWKTLAKATSTVTQAGSLIRLGAGTFIESTSSDLAVGVSIEGAGDTNTIVRSNVTGMWSNFLQLESPQDTNGAQSISNLTLDGQYVSESNNKTWTGITVKGRSNVSIHHTKIMNFRDRGVIFDGNDITDPTADPGHHATGNSFHHNTLVNSSAHDGNSGRGALNIGGQEGMEIYNNLIVQDQRVRFRNGWPIKYWDNGWLKAVRIHDNTLVKAPYTGDYPGEGGDWDFAIELFNIAGLEIDHNTIQGSIDLNYNRRGTYAHSAWIHDNTLNHQTPNSKFESGIILEFATQSVLIENNVLNNTSSGVSFNTRGVNDRGGYDAIVPAPTLGYSELTNNVIRNNVFSNMYQGDGVGTGGGVLVISEGTNDPQISNMQIYNNTFVAKSGDAPYVCLDFTSQENGQATGLAIRNNIIVGFQDSWLAGSSPSTRITNATITHNAASGNGNSNAPRWPSGAPTSSTISNNVTTSPAFVSATDFHLQATSPLINAGVDVGLPFLGAAPDLGAYESQ